MSDGDIQRTPISAELERVHQIQHAVDPNHLLPLVTLVGRNTLNPLVRPFDIYNDQIQVGDCFIDSDPPTMMRWIGHIRIFNESESPGEDFRRRGFATATYLAAITQAIFDGYSFRNDIRTENDYPKKIWEKLARVGVARVVEDYRPDKYGTYKGLYVVDRAP